MKLKLILNPFEKIAGSKALFVGLLFIIISWLASYPIGLHYKGLLSIGPAANDGLWILLFERIIIWLIPATLFYVGGRLLSSSKIRAIDVWGTMAFAQIPLTLFVFYCYIPPIRWLLSMDMGRPLMEIAEDPEFIRSALFTLPGLLFFVLALIWMFHALRVSCNLKEGRLWFVYLVGLFGGDILCKLILSQFYY